MIQMQHIHYGCATYLLSMLSVSKAFYKKFSVLLKKINYKIQMLTYFFLNFNPQYLLQKSKPKFSNCVVDFAHEHDE